MAGDPRLFLFSGHDSLVAKCRCERPVATDADLSGLDRWVKIPIERQRGAVIRKRAEGTRLSPKSVRHLTQTSG
jgi:hypothetical protein